MMFLFFIPLAAATPLPSGGGNSSALAAANCDPDYGWIDGPEGTNKCYMYLKDQAYSACFPDGGGGYPDWSCDPANPNCYLDCYDSYCCQDPYACGGGTAYTSYRLGGSDFYEEGTFQWANGDPFTFTQWGE